MSFRLGNRAFGIDDCRRYVQAYNVGYYAPARASNLRADALAYALFDGGLARDLSRLSRQLLFIGKDFGGAKVIPFDRVAQAIGERLLAITGYHEALAEAPSMEQAHVPGRTVDLLLTPFLGLPPSLGRKRNFPVWASKVLHFSRLDTFPVLDSCALTALGLSSSLSYSDYVSEYRPQFVAAIPVVCENCFPI